MAPTRIHVRFATNRNQIAGGALFGNDFANNDPKQYVTGSIDVVRLSNLPDTGWTPLIDTLVIDPPTPRTRNRARRRPPNRDPGNRAGRLRRRTSAGASDGRCSRLWSYLAARLCLDLH